MQIPTELHPLKPFLPENARLLMLGSFPPKKDKWSMDFYYPNYINDMWRIFGLVYFSDKEHFIVAGEKRFDKERIIEFLLKRGIALSDTASEVRRLQDNASDKFLEVVTPADLGGMLSQLPQCRAIAVTGQKAVDTIVSIIGASEPKVGGYSEFVFGERKMRLYRMPSSSRAYPLSLEKKAAAYKTLLEEDYIFS